MGIGVRRAVIALFGALIVCAAAPGQTAEQSAPAIDGRPPLTLVSWGGAYTRSIMAAYVKPFREATGHWVRVEEYDGSFDKIRKQVETMNVTWDLVSVNLVNAQRGCDEGLLEPISPSILSPAPDGTPAEKDFYQAALMKCGIGYDILSTVVAYDTTRMGDQTPTSLHDFFDLDSYPGPRGLRRRPQVALEWALLADGVPAAEIYHVLETPKGLERAFDVLDRIKPSIVWWDHGEEPIRLLEEGEVVMSSVWNGRVYAATAWAKAPLAIIWDGQVWNMDVWVMPKGGPNPQLAKEFITFATDPKRMAAQTSYLAYGPTRRSALKLIPEKVKQHMPTADDRIASAIRIDYAWWAKHGKRIRRQFDAWVEAEPFEYDFNPPTAH
ncbi:MAG: ABC transporter substrate-binding protein [Pseudomonadota bacterium]